MRDWAAIAQNVEAVYPQAIGGASRDEPLRAQLVPFGNSLFKEIEREQRWAGSYTTATIAVVAGTATYPVPTGFTAMQFVYWIDTAGGQQALRKFTQEETRRVYGEGPLAPPGVPVVYAVYGNTIQFFPVPDTNYTMFVEGYQVLNQIVETSGTTTAASATLTVPSTAYLTALGVPTAATTGLSVRGAGNLGVASVADTHVTNWSAFPLATTVTMTTPAVTAVAGLAAQVFFNSVNWLIADFDKVVLFGVLRMVATYLRSDSDYTMFEQRFQHEMDLMRAYEFDRSRTLEGFATAQAGQNQSQLRRQDQYVGVDVRGGVI